MGTNDLRFWRPLKLKYTYTLSKGFVTVSFLRCGVVNPLTNPQAGGPPLRLPVTAYSYISQLLSISGGRLPYPQPGDAPCREVRDPQTLKHSTVNLLIYKIYAFEISFFWHSLYNVEYISPFRSSLNLPLMYSHKVDAYPACWVTTGGGYLVYTERS